MLLEKNSLKIAFVMSIYWLIFGITVFAENPTHNTCHVPIIVSKTSSDTNLHRSIGSNRCVLFSRNNPYRIYWLLNYHYNTSRVRSICMGHY